MTQTATKMVTDTPVQSEVTVGGKCPFIEQPCPHQCVKADASQGRTWCTMWVNFQREVKK